MYAIRIDVIDDSTHAKMVSLLDTIKGSYFIVSEHGKVTSKLHYQGWICTEENLSAIRKRRQRMMPENNGKELHSLTNVKHPDYYKLYVCKGESPTEPPIIAFQQAIDIDANALHAEYWSKRPRGINGKPLQNKSYMMEELVAYFNSVAEYDKSDVMRRVVQTCIDMNKPLFDNYIIAVYRHVQCRISKTFLCDFVTGLLYRSDKLFL